MNEFPNINELNKMFIKVCVICVNLSADNQICINIFNRIKSQE